ncbi:MAG: succinate dehydrogenase cytochrome b558 subunit [Pirellula sp.]
MNPAPPSAPTENFSLSGFLKKHDFLIRRLHSLSGLVPVGAYMCVHLITNSSLNGGPAVFQNAVFAIHSIPFLPIVEWTFIFLPILFHAIVGVWIARSGHSNLRNYRFTSNKRYWLQRTTGYIAFAFIFIHVLHLHGWFHWDWWLGFVEPLGMAQFRPYNAASSLAQAMQSLGFLWPLVYFVGVVACVFHLANGIWTAGITWGLWVSPTAQKRATRFCAAFGVLLGLAGLSSLVRVSTLDPASAKVIEDQMYKVRVEGHMIDPNPHKRTDGHHSASSAEASHGVVSASQAP